MLRVTGSRSSDIRGGRAVRFSVTFFVQLRLVELASEVVNGATLPIFCGTLAIRSSSIRIGKGKEAPAETS